MRNMLDAEVNQQYPCVVLFSEWNCMRIKHGGSQRRKPTRSLKDYTAMVHASGARRCAADKAKTIRNCAQ